MKKIFLAMALLLSIVSQADNFTTAGDGTTYSFAKLAEIPGSSVEKTDGDNAFIVRGCNIIAANDRFEIEQNGVVYFEGDGEIVIEGEPLLVAGEAGIRLCLFNSEDKPSGITVKYDQNIVDVKNITFEGVGLKHYALGGMNIDNCTFKSHHGGAAGALFLGTDGAEFNVSNCSFTDCAKAAIGGAANFFCPITIENCVFRKNSRANSNIPQLNLTAATNVTITNCVVEGLPELNMVGGIGISNFYGTEGFHVEINNCHIYNNRYGITTMGVMDAVITDNIIENNCYETNPNNGGSGISLYDPYMKQTAIISGNTITGNLWGITVIGCSDVNIGRTDLDVTDEKYNRGENIFRNNGNGGQLYDLYNNSSNDIYAQGNLWGVDVQDETHIEEVVFHKHDDASLGQVFYMPAASEELSIDQTITKTNAERNIYNLNGQRLAQPAKGINIVNGKKIIVR